MRSSTIDTTDVIRFVDRTGPFITTPDAEHEITVGDLATAIGGGGGGASQATIEEYARDAIYAALTEGAGIVKSVDDAGNTITLSVDQFGVATYSGSWPTRPSFDTVVWVSTDRAATAPGAATGTDIVLLPAPILHWDFPLSSTGPAATSVATGTAVVAWRTPYAITVTAVETWLEEASSSGVVTVDVNEGAGAGTTILSTRPSIDATELASANGTAAVVSDTSLASGARITFDIDAAGTDAHGLWCRIFGYPT